VENKGHTVLTGQSSHKDLVEKSGQLRFLFDKSCLQSILFHTKIWPAAHFFH